MLPRMQKDSALAGEWLNQIGKIFNFADLHRQHRHPALPAADVARLTRALSSFFDPSHFPAWSGHEKARRVNDQATQPGT